MERISREDCVQFYKVDVIFFDDLAEAGLIETIIEENSVYLSYERLDHFEKLVNWHYDLDINIPGLEVIHQLLSRIEALQAEKNELLTRI